MVPYIPPELTDLIIHKCATPTNPTPTSTNESANRQARTTLLACSLVCKSWVPTSRSITFSRITLRCTPEDLRSFANLVTSPICSFHQIAREINFVIPDAKPTVYKSSFALQNLFSAVLKYLRPMSITITGGNQGKPPKPTLIREPLRLAFNQLFYTTRSWIAPNSLTLASLLFESFSDMTLLLRSFPGITSLHLHNLSFVLSNLSPHLPLQHLEILHMDGSQTIPMVITWLMSFPQMSAPPIREVTMNNISQSRVLPYLVGYLSSSRDVLERCEVGFEEGWETKGLELLNKMIQDSGKNIGDLPVVIIKRAGSPIACIDTKRVN